MNYKSSADVCKLLQISRPTLKAWRETGRISSIKLSDRKYLYDIDSVMKDGSADSRIRPNFCRERDCSSRLT